jgi:CHAT domain-containing protein
VVNVAARVVSNAQPDQILISKATYAQLSDSIPCRSLGTTSVKGKSLPVELYAVLWDEDSTVQEPVLRGSRGRTRQSGKTCVLEVSREEHLLKISTYEHWPGEQPPVKHYEHRVISWETIQPAMDAMVRLLNRATDQQGALDTATWQDIKVYGATLYDQIFTPAIQEKLRTSSATELVLHIDDALVCIPWELLFDGHTFLCRRFSMGRIVSTQQVLVEGQRKPQEQTLTMLIVADPQGNLAAAAQEGHTIRAELLAEAHCLQVDLRSTQISTQLIRGSLSQYAVLHYAGHADYNVQQPAQSGWHMADGTLTASDILHLGQAAPLPALVFCNACQSGQTAAWEISHEVEHSIYGLANAFLLAGAQHYIGTFWEVPDQPSAMMAIEFYRALARGTGVGEALRSARQALAERYGEESVVWTSYVLYGDPEFRYLIPAQEKPSSTEASSVPQAVQGQESRRRWHWKRHARRWCSRRSHDNPCPVLDCSTWKAASSPSAHTHCRLSGPRTGRSI